MAKAPNRALWGLALCLLTGWLGLLIGATVGRMVVPDGTMGFDAIGFVLGYAFAGAAAMIVLAVLVALKGSAALLRTSTIVSIFLTMLSLAAVGWGIYKQNEAREKKYGLDKPLPAPQPFQLHASTPDSDMPRGYREIDVNGEDWRFQYVATGPEAARCGGELSADEATNLTAAIRATAHRLQAAGEGLCDNYTGDPIVTIEVSGAMVDGFRISAPNSCISKEDALSDLNRILFRIPIDAVSQARVDCR